MNNDMLRTGLLSSCFLIMAAASAQYFPPDPAGLEGVIVEKYYVADANDAADTDGGSIAEGATVYRVYVDMLDGYKLQTVGGFTNHPLTFNTTTVFFYNEDRGEAWSDDINDIYLDNNTVALDSWLAMGAASDAHWGVLKKDDNDGSIIGGSNNDGGSNGVPGGLLVNHVPTMGKALTTADGLFLAGSAPGSPVNLGDAPTIFNEPNGSTYSSQDFAYGVLATSGTESPFPGNRVLIGQFTTDGDFSFCLNLYVKIPTALVCPSIDCHTELIFYGTLLEADTAGIAISGDNKFTHPTLCFNSATAVFDCEGIAGGAALAGTPCDDGNPDTEDDVWNAQCQCAGDQTGMEEAAIGIGMQVMPNPAEDALRVSLEGLNGEQVSYSLKDATGRTVKQAELGTLNGEWRGVVDMAELRSGVYLLELRVDDAVRTERVVRK